MKHFTRPETPGHQGMIRPFGRRVLVVLSFLLLADPVLALVGDMRKDPTEMVKQYLMLDQNGARLDALSFETMKPFINWKEEPVWGHAVVISGYTMATEIKQWEVISDIEVVIPVKFRVLGLIYWETASFLPESGEIEVRFRIKGIKERWRIIDPILPPHVGQKRMINYVRQAMLEEKDPSRLATLTALRDDLKNAK
jgi:hypothetical protein